MDHPQKEWLSLKNIEFYYLPTNSNEKAPLAKALSKEPVGMPKSRASRRQFLSTLTRLGLSASVAPLVFHLLEARARGEAVASKLDAQDRVLTGQFFFPRLEFQCYADAPNKKWDIWPVGDQVLRTHVKKNSNINILTDPIVVNLDHPDRLVQYPFVFMTSEGKFRLSPESTKNLREYLFRGGFLYADDCCFEQRLDYFYLSWVEEMKRIFPDATIKAVPADHEVFHCFYDLTAVPHCQGVQHQPMGLFDKTSGRLMSMCTSGDIHCGWVGFGNLNPNECKKSLELGTNIIIHCLTH